MITSVGLQETQLKLRAFSGAINGPERLTIARAGGIVVQSEAKIRAPKKTGTLSRSIQMVNSGAGSVDVGTNLIYAAIQEFGGTIMGNPWLVFQTDRKSVV